MITLADARARWEADKVYEVQVFSRNGELLFGADDECAVEFLRGDDWTDLYVYSKADEFNEESLMLVSFPVSAIGELRVFKRPGRGDD